MTTITYPVFFDKMIGSTVPLSTIPTLAGSIGTTWINFFTSEEDYQWQHLHQNYLPDQPEFTGNETANLFYYGRDLCYASFHKMSGYTNAAWLDRALAHSQNHYDVFFHPNAGNVNEFQLMSRSMGLLYSITGNSAVLNDIGKQGTLMWGNSNNNRIEEQCFNNASTAYWPLVVNMDPSNQFIDNLGVTRHPWQSTGADPRTKARELEHLVTCHILDAPKLATPGGLPHPGTAWATLALGVLNKILAAQDPTGSWREPFDAAWKNWTVNYDPNGVDGWGTVATGLNPATRDTSLPPYPAFGVKTFESALVHDAMIYYYENVDPDPRILSAILASMNYIETGGTWPGNQGSMWYAPNKGWRYVELGGGNTYSSPAAEAPLLNGMIATSTAWLYKMTGDLAWKTRTELAMSSVYDTSAPNALLANSLASYSLKLLNQNYYRSYLVWPWLYGATGVVAAGGRPDGDVTLGGWKNETGGAALYPSIGEATPDNATFIYSGTGLNDGCEVSLSDPAGAIVNGPIKYRYGKRLNNGVVVNLRVRLMQGTTEIARWDHANIPFAPIDATQALTAPQFAAITTPADLRLQFVRDAP